MSKKSQEEWLGYVKATLETIDRDLERLRKDVRGLEDRVRATELRSATYGAVSGIIMAIIVTVVAQAIRAMMAAG